MLKAYKSLFPNAKRVRITPLVLVQVEGEPAHCMTLAELLDEQLPEGVRAELELGLPVEVEPYAGGPAWSQLDPKHQVHCSGPAASGADDERCPAGAIATWYLATKSGIVERYACEECHAACVLRNVDAFAETIRAQRQHPAAAFQPGCGAVCPFMRQRVCDRMPGHDGLHSDGEFNWNSPSLDGRVLVPVRGDAYDKRDCYAPQSLSDVNHECSKGVRGCVNPTHVPGRELPR